MNTFNFFNITNPVVTIPITIIMGFMFIVVLFNLFKNTFLAKYKRLEESGFWKNIWHFRESARLLITDSNRNQE